MDICIRFSPQDQDVIDQASGKWKGLNPLLVSRVKSLRRGSVLSLKVNKLDKDVFYFESSVRKECKRVFADPSVNDTV